MTVKVCVSTGCIAFVDEYPPGLSVYPYHIEISQVRFEPSGIYYDMTINSYANGHAIDSVQLDRFLKCFGLDWRNCQNFDDALNRISLEYEMRCVRMEKRGKDEV